MKTIAKQTNVQDMDDFENIRRECAGKLVIDDDGYLQGATCDCHNFQNGGMCATLIAKLQGKQPDDPWWWQPPNASCEKLAKPGPVS